MNTTTTSIDDLQEFVADESSLLARKGHRRLDSPNFIFFDDDREEDEDILWGRELALDFEEWNAARTAWIESQPDEEAQAYLERMEQKSRNLWLIEWHKRQSKSSNNDNWRSAMAPVIEGLEGKHGPTCRAIIQGMREALPFAPGPIRGTTFVNPDGSKHTTAGVDFGRAKASYLSRHKLTEDIVSVDRVQHEGERYSRLVVGQRKSSELTMSSYYDPNPAWKDYEGGTYSPRACALYKVPDHLVMPKGSHRLTVRQFEQALIAGADCYEDQDEAFAQGMEDGYVVDDRIKSGFEAARDISSFTEEEQYLYNLLYEAGHLQACELISLQDQIPGLLHSYFFRSENPDSDEAKIRAMEGGNEVIKLLEKVMADDSWGVRKVFVKQVDADGNKIGVIEEKPTPPVNREPMFHYVLGALTTTPEGTIGGNLTMQERINQLKKGDDDGPSAFDIFVTYSEFFQDVVKKGDAFVRPAHRNWK